MIEEILAARKGRKMVFTNGVFDILHAGHVSYLEAARELGDFLVVGVNDDDSVRRLGKGVNRPINALEDRLTVIRALRSVDYALPFAEDTPEALIAALRPEIHVKGGDYTRDQLPEARAIDAYGGNIVILPLLEGRSTSIILNRLADR